MAYRCQQVSKSNLSLDVGLYILLFLISCSTRYYVHALSFFRSLLCKVPRGSFEHSETQMHILQSIIHSFDTWKRYGYSSRA